VGDEFMLNFVICDDNKAVLDRLCKMLESIFIQNKIDAEVSFSTTKPEDVISYLEQNTANVIFLDIDLHSKISGLDLANSIRKKNKQIYIIFTSVHLEYILVAYKYKTFDFLPKPISIERLSETIIRLMDDIESVKIKNSFINIDNKNTIVDKDSIRFIKKNGMKLVFYTDTRTYETYSSFNKISEKLPSNFVRCHKSYIANIDKITDVKINDNVINFDNNGDFKCFIGPKYKNKFMEVFKNDGNVTINLDSTNNRK